MWMDTVIITQSFLWTSQIIRWPELQIAVNLHVFLKKWMSLTQLQEASFFFLNNCLEYATYVLNLTKEK